MCRRTPKIASCTSCYVYSPQWFTVHKYARLITKQNLNFTFRNVRPVGCRPVSLLAYSLQFNASWGYTIAHTQICTNSKQGLSCTGGTDAVEADSCVDSSKIH